MKIKNIATPLILFVFLSIFANLSYAKVLPRFRTGVKTTAASSGVGVSVRLRTDRRALNVAFSNLNKASSVSYTLMYDSNGVAQGVAGSLDTSQGSTTRELLFGTCSSGVCRYHPGIKNMKLEVQITLTSGKTLLKRYKVRP